MPDNLAPFCILNANNGWNYIYRKLSAMQNILLISESTVKSNSEISDNLYGKYLLPAIRTAQEMYLQPVLGSTLYNNIIAVVSDGTITADTNSHLKELLDDYIQPYLLERVLADLVPIVSAKVANLGTVHSKDEYVENLSVENAEKLQTLHIQKSDFYLRRMQEYLLANSSMFDLDACTCNSLASNLNSAASTGLWLGGYRARILR